MTDRKASPPSDATISDAILALATTRGGGKTICPSEVARHVAGPDDTAWRLLMPTIRRLAVHLARQGRIDIKKGGKVVNPENVAGIYRIAIKT